MAKHQTRRAVSLNREVYVAASLAAFRQGKTLSQLATDGFRALGIAIPDTRHTPVEVAQLAAEAVRLGTRLRGGSRYTTRHRMKVGTYPSARVVDCYRLIQRDGPIRRALSDAHADACGEPHWHERRSV